ncbi:MAG: zinc ribbon domain-containing protein [Chloroflexi bacterium]|nr:zinc ribbon domain-containing protein [Chloroflexota bacterium]
MKKVSVLFRILLLLGMLATMAFVVSPVTAASDNPLTIKAMKLSVWPEYDDTRILVMYQGEFKDGSAFPKLVKFPTPAGSEINQVCALKQPGNEHLCQLYDTSTEQETMNISYTLPIPTYFLEYYWDGIKGQPDKSFNFKYVAPYAIDKLDVEVQQPLKATNFKPPEGYTSVNTDSAGLKYYTYTFSNVAPGQVINVDASYTKSDSKPSVAKKQGSGTGTGAGGINTPMLLGVVGGALVLLIIGFAVFKRKPVPATVRAAQSRRAARFEAQRQAEERRRASKREPIRQTKQEQVKPVQSARQASGASPAPGARQTSGGGQFCTRCGTRLDPNDNFCNACGQKTRRAA